MENFFRDASGNALPLELATKSGAGRSGRQFKKLKIAWRLCYSRKPFRELCPRMRTPERGQLEAYTIGCQKPSRGFSGQLQTHQSLVLDSICYTKRLGIVQGGNKKSYGRSSAAVPGACPAPVLARRVERETHSGQPARCRRCTAGL